MDWYQYYRLLLSVMLATNCIDPSVNNFSFLTDSIDHQWAQKFFLQLNRTIGFRFFSSSKDHRSNRCFLQLINYWYQSDQCFICHWCPPMQGIRLGSSAGAFSCPREWSPWSSNFWHQFPSSAAWQAGPDVPWHVPISSISVALNVWSCPVIFLKETKPFRAQQPQLWPQQKIEVFSLP
jgi:hypothetical protein